MRGSQRLRDKKAEATEAAATVVVAWRRGLRPAADLVLGQPSEYDLVEAVLGAPVPESPRSKLRERALREETLAAIDIVLAGSIARRVITGEGSIPPNVLHRAASLAKRVVSGREVQKVVSDAVERVEADLGDADVRRAVQQISAELTERERLEAEQIEALLRDRVRLGWSWWGNLSTPARVALSRRVSARDCAPTLPLSKDLLPGFCS